MVVAVPHEIMANFFGSVHRPVIALGHNKFIFSNETIATSVFVVQPKCCRANSSPFSLETPWFGPRGLGLLNTGPCKFATVSFAMAFQRSTSTFCTHQARHESLSILNLTTIGPCYPQGNGYERFDVGTPHTTKNQNAKNTTNKHKLTNVTKSRRDFMQEIA